MTGALLPVWVYGLPAEFVFQPDGGLREPVRRCIDKRVVRVIAGPTACHVMVDVKRPYNRQPFELEAAK